MIQIELACGVVGCLLAGLLIARVLAWVIALNRHEELRDAHTVIAEYDAPTRLSAAELGYIVDSAFGSNELLATIAQLYRKNMVDLTALPPDNFIITATDTHGSVDDGESSVLGYLRSLPDATTTWKRFDSVVSDAVGPQADFEDSVIQSLSGKGLLRSTAFEGMFLGGGMTPKVIASIVTGLALLAAYAWQHAHLAVGTSVGYAKLDASIVHLVFLGLAMPFWLAAYAYINLVRYIYNRQDGTPLRATSQLNSLWPDVAGYQLFLRETEYVRLQHDLNPRDPSMEYCLALGLDPGFIKSLAQNHDS